MDAGKLLLVSMGISCLALSEEVVVFGGGGDSLVGNCYCCRSDEIVLSVEHGSSLNDRESVSRRVPCLALLYTIM